ncbi:F-box domain-containing protein [Colletotrichum simmondsii]|uniref:F-box domain-containing protein n=1 Tax=Colletotrichum simmondsii TaxID=703756 RepID=A0A135T211_9PEZI|nr:F-box domain-containing protein [Colletotrichum simmondsii]
MSKTAEKHALVFGSSGITGWAIVNAILQGYPSQDAFDSVTALTNRPINSEITQWPVSEKLHVVSGVNILTLGGQEALETDIRNKVENLRKITHVYFCGMEPYIMNLDPVMECEINTDLVQKAVTAIDRLSPSLQFVVLPTGTKAYGIHLIDRFPFAKELPLRESLPRIPEPFGSQLFYYHQIDALSRLCEEKSWSWCEIRADTIVGFVPNNNICCAAQTLGIYLSLFAEIEGKGAECPFPGNEKCWSNLSHESNQDILAKICIYASLHPNVTHKQKYNAGDNFQPSFWRYRWPIICEYFGLKGTPPLPDRQAPQPEHYLVKHVEEWKETEKKHGLVGGHIINDRTFIEPTHGVGMIYGLTNMLGFDRQLDMTQCHEMWDSSKEEIDTKCSWHTVFDRNSHVDFNTGALNGFGRDLTPALIVELCRRWPRNQTHLSGQAGPEGILVRSTSMLLFPDGDVNGDDAKRDKLAALPEELLIETLNRLCHKDLCNVSRLNKRYHRLADAVLYKSVHFQSPELHLTFSESLGRRPRRGSAINEVKLIYPNEELSRLALDAPVHNSHYDPTRSDTLSRTLSVMSNLEKLDIAVPHVLLHGIGTLFNGPFDLAYLKECTLFYQCADDAYWDLRENIHIFAHPTLETLIIKRAKLDEKGFDFMERPHETGLKKLHLLECDINDDGLSDLLEFPEGLEEFVMTQTAEPKPELEESSDNFADYVLALNSQAHSLKMFTIDSPTLGCRKPLRMREFEALKSMKMNWDYQLFGKTSKKPRMHSVGLPPEMEVLEFFNEMGSDEEVTDLLLYTIQTKDVVAKAWRTFVVPEGDAGVSREIKEACREHGLQLDIIGAFDTDGEAD